MFQVQVLPKARRVTQSVAVLLLLLIASGQIKSAFQLLFLSIRTKLVVQWRHPKFRPPVRHAKALPKF